jgi:undecaprenyl-diphosphatase
MLEWWQILVLAVIQGAAELLPVSSSAHVILAEKLMGLDPSSPEMTFLLVMLHTGTMVAVLVYYWRRWRAMVVSPAAGRPADRESIPLPRAGEVRTDALTVPPPVTGTAPLAPSVDVDVREFRPILYPARPSLLRFVLLVMLATAVTGVFGGGLLLLIERVVLEGLLHRPKGEVEELFKSLPLIGTALLAAGGVILVAGWLEGRTAKRPLTWGAAVWIGLVQGLCLPFRGFSRSGATISTGMLVGVPRSLSEEFSFALALVLTPPVIARYAWRLLKDREWATAEHVLNLLTPGLIGMALSCLAGLAALRLLSAMLDKGRWWYFGVYCVLAAGVMYVAAAVLPTG